MVFYYDCPICNIFTHGLSRKLRDKTNSRKCTTHKIKQTNDKNDNNEERIHDIKGRIKPPNTGSTKNVLR